MHILAGVDEAGLGPTLGPLVTASAALEVPDDWQPDTPWKRLGDAVADAWRRGQTLPVAADSKKIYVAGGMAALELTVGAFSLLANGSPAPSVDDSAPDAARHPCYLVEKAVFPTHADGREIETAAKRLTESLAREKASVARLRAFRLFEPGLNRRFDSGLNKNQALLMETGRHLSELAAGFPDRRIVAVVDKQGGRNAYLHFLGALFPGSWLDVLEEGAAVSRYRLRRDGGDMEIRFIAKADRDSFPTALASMLAKYCRERCMAGLNAWFSERLPGLKPTAGYPTDAARWKNEVSASGLDAAGLDKLTRKR